MSNFTVLFDACVLYPAPIRDLLMHLAVTGLFRAKWTEDINREWIESLLLKRPDLSRERLERTKNLMNLHVEDCLVENYEQLIDSIVLPDKNDRHVLAAAIKSNTSVILTFNHRDFPVETLMLYGIETQDPDTFITHLFDLNPSSVCLAAKRQRANLKSPPRKVSEFLDILESHRLPQTALLLRPFSEML